MENKDKQKECPLVVVSGLIRNNEGKILLAKCVKWGGKYGIFGGKLESGEVLEDGVKREVMEEVGIEVEVIKNISIMESIFSEQYSEKKHMIFLDYLCEFNGDDSEIELNNEYEGKAKWFSPQEALDQLKLTEGTKVLLEKYVKSLEEEDYLTGWKRCQADFDNYRKNQAQKQKEYIEFANRNLIEEILPVINNFEASLAHVPAGQENNPWVTGITYIQKQLEKVLEDNGVSEIVVKAGDDFDENLHEAVKTVSSEQAAVNSKQRAGNNEQETMNNKQQRHIVAEVLQKGYKIGDKIIRPARVVVE